MCLLTSFVLKSEPLTRIFTNTEPKFGVQKFIRAFVAVNFLRCVCPVKRILIPLFFNYDKTLYKNKIQGFFLAGFSFGIKESQFMGINRTINVYENSVTITTDWTELNKKLINVFYTTGVGCRFNLIDELDLELGIKYNFRFKDDRAYTIKLDYSNGKKSTYNFKEHNDYFNATIGIFYSFEKTYNAVKKGLQWFN